MPGPMPKPSGIRQRRNRTGNAATLRPDDPAWTRARERQEVPELPPWGGRRQWRPEVIAWWVDLWRSPMATEYYRVDFWDLVEIARLKHDLAGVRDATKRPRLMAEIRVQEQRFGLDPRSRRQLQWEVEKGEEAAERTSQRRQRRAASAARSAGDPRAALKAVQ